MANDALASARQTCSLVGRGPMARPSSSGTAPVNPSLPATIFASSCLIAMAAPPWFQLRLTGPPYPGHIHALTPGHPEHEPAGLLPAGPPVPAGSPSSPASGPQVCIEEGDDPAAGIGRRRLVVAGGPGEHSHDHEDERVA